MRIVIIGIAKTGTTALFYKIHNNMEFLTPVFEHKSNKDNVLVKLLINKNNPSVNDFNEFINFDKTVFIIRDIRDVIISSLLYSTGYHRSKEQCYTMINLLQKKRN